MKNILKGWSTFEKIWLVVFTAIILTTGFIFKDTAIGITASLTGVLTVVLVSQGKISNYYFGIVNIVLYAYISYKTGLYGETMLNVLFYFPIQFIGLYMWSKNMTKDSVVKTKKLSSKGWVFTFATVLIVGVLYGLFLTSIGSQQASVDGFAVVLSITATLLMINRYAEQWLLWIAVNVLTIGLWANVFMEDGNSITILVMWIAYFFNSVIAWFKWNKMHKNQKEEGLVV